MANLVGGGVAKVVLGQATSGNSSGADDDTIVVESGGAGRNGLGEVGVSEVGGTGKEVDVQVGVGALAERALHGQLGRVRSPLGVDSPVGTGLRELDIVGGEGRVQDVELLVQGSLGKVPIGNSLGPGNDVPVDVDVDGSQTSGVASDAGVLLLEHQTLSNLDLLLRGRRSAARALSEGAGGDRESGENKSLELHLGGGLPDT